ncbi:hypothetical protein F5J12DRAFT_891551 [Pisolithus orientalis]|uniref:uncharacterized protein n=1 Tax=Pisolithus orientalis TaxID=936130 RepID=UPI0022255526|nr:uncharacterized protein F5J12DRAFT_891551 [Pisolithus orientalis]KAI6009443.1 hypothetical protein F5J12DRAFT_891551 [Pisolithus orientalis]
MSKRKQDTETSDDSNRVKRVKDNLGVAKPVPMTRPASSAATGSQSAQTEVTDKRPGKEIRKAIPNAPKTNASSPSSASDTGPSVPVPTPLAPAPAPPRKRPRILKLAPPRPYPTVPIGRSATGPRSTSTRPSPDEPLCLCVTRKTALAAYIRRCKSAFLQDGAREIRLSAMGAAIPHLAVLVGSLTTQGILPFAQDDLEVEVYTGSGEVVDEILSDSESESGEKVQDTDTPKEEFRKRTKSTMNVIIRHKNGNTNPAEAEGVRAPANQGKRKRRRRGRGKGKVSAEEGQQSGVKAPRRIVIQEPEQEDSDGS